MLDGVRIVEMASVITGPLAGCILADLGADVIKVEGPPDGDPFRAWSGGSEQLRASFAAFNRGKRSIAIDIKTSAGRRTYEDLVRSADAVIENFRPGKMDALGIGYERLAHINPGLVYCHITGQGLRGPNANNPTYDAVAQALSGLWSQFTDLSSPEPVGPPLADQLTGIYSAVAILSGLQARERTGRGRQLHVDMLASSLSFSTLGVAETTWNDQPPTHTSRSRTSQTYAFVDRDGAPFAIHLSTPPKFWKALCKVVGRPDLADDPDYVTKTVRIKNYDALHRLLAEEFKADSRASWLQRLSEHDVPAAPLLTVREALAHPQVVANGLVAEGDPSEGGGLANSPIIDGDTRSKARSGRTPHYGQHTAEILDELRAQSV